MKRVSAALLAGSMLAVTFTTAWAPAAADAGSTDPFFAQETEPE